MQPESKKLSKKLKMNTIPICTHKISDKNLLYILKDELDNYKEVLTTLKISQT